MFDIKRKCVAGPFGDECCSYEIDFPKGLTLDKFIISVLREYPNEWGNFHLKMWHPFAKYKNGKLFISNFKDYQVNKDKEIVNIKAHGGWSAMDYIITIESDPKPEIKVNINETTDFLF